MINIVELMAGFISVSIPTYRPLYRKWFSGSSLRGKTTRRDTAKYGGSHDSENHADRVYTKALPKNVNVKAGRAGNEPRNGINVTDEIELVHHTNLDGTWIRVPDDDETRLFNPENNTKMARGWAGR